MFESSEKKGRVELMNGDRCNRFLVKRSAGQQGINPL